MRIILYTGKGGVGKTSVAAATALRASELGYRTIVISTDAAHSLADSFDVPLGPEPRLIAPNLWGQEIDVFYELQHNWGTIQEYVASVMTWRGLDDVVAEEMTILPGVEELASLLQITTHHDSGHFDVIIIDSAPTGETLRLLTFPEVARWWMEKIFPIERQAAKVLRPIVRPLVDIPLPEDDVFESVSKLFTKLDRMHSLLADPNKSSIRLVLNPEKMVIKEAQRTYTYLKLFNYPVDAIIANRLMPGFDEPLEASSDVDSEVADSEEPLTVGMGRNASDYLHSWRRIQAGYMRVVEESFSPVPIFRAPYFKQEVVGIDMLKAMAQALFGSEDPTRIFYRSSGHYVEKVGDDYVLHIPLPFASKENIELSKVGEELVVRIGNQRRNIFLPRALVGLEVLGARLEEGTLHVIFARRKV